MSTTIRCTARIDLVVLSGLCTYDALPGMVVCAEHATRDAMGMHIRSLAKALEARGGDPDHPHDVPIFARALIVKLED